MSLIRFTTASRDGDARAPGALAKILKSKSLPIHFACAEQVHGHKIDIVPALRAAKKYMGADGLITDAPNQPLVIFTADCVPVFLASRDRRVVGVLHAGWRGVQARILPKAVRMIRKKWNIVPKDLLIWFGPSIGPCCFEVGWDVARYFPHTRIAKKDKWYVDLGRELGLQANKLGVRVIAKKEAGDCTMHGSRYYSYRRDKTDKRLGSVILKKRS